MSSDNRETAYYDPNMRLPPFVLHAFPVVLAIFTLTMSVAGYKIFFGFDEDEPITWMSLTLMAAVLVVVLAAIRNDGLDRLRRFAAVVLGGVGAFALLDERYGWHEDVGRWVKDHVEVFSRDVRHYTDDVIVVLFALAGTLLFAFLLRALPNRRSYLPYLACVAALAFAHGFLDVLGHGGRLWRVFLPDITKDQVDLLTGTLGFYEEACKLWAEWFVLLFVLRFFHGQRGPLLWSLSVMAGSFLSGVGLWAIEDPNTGVPYIVMERTLRLLRNHHLLFLLATIFVVWALVAWRWFGDQPKKQALAGLFFLAPFYAVLPAMARNVNVAYSPIGASGVIFAGLSGQLLMLLAIGGLVFPMMLGSLARGATGGGMPRVLLVVATLAVLAAVLAAVVANPLWWLCAFGVVLIVWIERQTVPISTRTWVVVGVAQALVIAYVFVVSASGMLPEYRFEVPEKVLFETGAQTIDPDFYRSDP